MIERHVRSPHGARRGQSFIEAMVAITVIITAISSSLALIQSSITATRVGGMQVIAANLAREGLEVVRAARDTNWLMGRSFQVGLVDGAGNKTARPMLDTENGSWTLSFEPTSMGAANAAVYLMSDGVYRQADTPPTGGAASPYSRLLTLQHVCRDDGTGVERIVGSSATCLGSETLAGLAVYSTVRWRGAGGQQQTLAVEERLYDWR
ncbi:MAG: hypothetical protein AAB554_00375 [Patescibacteria group bacterium]|mgnify:CR=1 FL=1